LDDCAVTTFNDTHDLVIGSDFVRGEGFLLYQKGYMTAEQVGWYLVGANLSDVAAMGARPFGVVAATRYHKSHDDQHFLSIMKGIVAACATYGAPLLGGDTGSYEAPVLSAAAFGLVPKGRALLRSRARVDDRVYLTGTVGSAGAAYALLQNNPDAFANLPPPILEGLCAPWRRVEPALAHGAYLAESGLSQCALDTSDGLYTSCRLLAQASGVSMVIDASAIPVGIGVAEVGQILNQDPIALACSDSVDFRLLFTVPEAAVVALEAGMKQASLPIYAIGSVIKAGDRPQVYLSRDGRLEPMQAQEKNM
jgi:thiamine-monophosphate kinase